MFRCSAKFCLKQRVLLDFLEDNNTNNTIHKRNSKIEITYYIKKKYKTTRCVYLNK